MSTGARTAKSRKKKPDPATEAFAAGLALVKRNPALAAVEAAVCRNDQCRSVAPDGLVAVDSNGTLHAHHQRREPADWAWAISHALLHLGFGHVPADQGERPRPTPAEIAARCTVVNRFLASSPVGRAPDDLPAAYPGTDEEQLAATWHRPPPFRSWSSGTGCSMRRSARRPPLKR